MSSKGGGQSLNVRRDAVIEAVKAKRQKAVEKYEGDTAVYPSHLAVWQMNSVSILDGWREQIGRGESVSIDYSNRLPNKPAAPVLDTSQFDRHLALLEAVTDEIIPVSSSNFGVYF